MLLNSKIKLFKLYLGVYGIKQLLLHHKDMQEFNQAKSGHIFQIFVRGYAHSLTLVR